MRKKTEKGQTISVKDINYWYHVDNNEKFKQRRQNYGIDTFDFLLARIDRPAEKIESKDSLKKLDRIGRLPQKKLTQISTGSDRWPCPKNGSDLNWIGTMALSKIWIGSQSLSKNWIRSNCADPWLWPFMFIIKFFHHKGF